MTMAGSWMPSISSKLMAAISLSSWKAAAASSGGRAPRNPDYNHALTLLLTRLGKLNAVLVDALVDSRYTQDLGLPEADRRLIQAPIRLALEPDPEALRRRLGTAQAKIAQAADATKGGNATKRIRLRVSVPGFQPGDAGRLAQALAAPAPRRSGNRPGYWWEHECWRERLDGDNPPR